MELLLIFHRGEFNATTLNGETKTVKIVETWQLLERIWKIVSLII